MHWGSISCEFFVRLKFADLSTGKTVAQMSSKHSNICKALAHVTFGEVKRIVSFDKGKDIQGLRHDFIRVFSDVLSDEVAPAQVKFQRFDEHFKDYVELQNEEKLEKDTKLKVIIAPKGKQQAQGDFPRKNSIPEVDEETKWPLLTRKLIVNKTYRLWNPVHNAILQRNSSTDEVKCNGSLDHTTEDMVMLLVDSEIDGRRLHFNTNYVVARQGEGNAITTVDLRTNPNAYSEIEYFTIGFFTMFKDKQSGQYLGCDGNGTAVFMDMENMFFPNPQALFIANMYELPPTPISA